MTKQGVVDPVQLRLEQYRALLQVSESIAVNRHLPDLIRDLSVRLRDAVQFDYIGLLLHDPLRNVLRVQTMETPIQLPIAAGFEMRVDESPAGEVWQSQQPFISPDLEKDNRYRPLFKILRDLGVKSYCSLPLTSPVRRLGALSFCSLHRDAYSRERVDFLQLVARQVAVAVDNALHYKDAQTYQTELRKERDRLQLLLRVNNALVSNLDLKTLFVAISKSLREVLHNDYTSLALHDKEGNRLKIYALDFPTGSGLVREAMDVPLEGSRSGKAFTERKPLLMKDFHSPEFNSDVSKRLSQEGLRSGLSVPLISNQGPIAAMTLASRKVDAFSESDLDLLVQISVQVAIAVENALAFQQIGELKNKLAKEKLYLEDEIRTEFNFDEIVGKSQALRRILQQIENVAATDSTVLILGETGTGKELIARAIHNLSGRTGHTFVKLNCSAIPAGLLESELFGHERGAFTGAIAQKIGRFELADGGTLFLDEVGDIPLELQPKLLRVLQEQEFERLGSTRTISTNVRLVAATNRDLETMVGNREFRSDLFYRINVFPIIAPPLRERLEDVPLLVRYFAQKLSRRMNKRIETVSEETMNAMMRYHWPGNIRELENFVERAVILTKGTNLNAPVFELERHVSSPEADGAAGEKLATMEAAEREHILNALRSTRWTIAGPNGAAARLGMKRTTLQSRMKKLGITRSSLPSA
ncbi:MAG TPA: sigma 54-interacting transcriptional regulator [Terriglobia bacterium]|nr:sigma 54-interacting transcriptional regulator [Terriglobia bacterium]